VRGPIYQYQQHVEPLFTGAAPTPYDPATLGWLPVLPDPRQLLAPPGPDIQLGQFALPLFTSPAVPYDPADLAWSPSLPDAHQLLPPPGLLVVAQFGVSVGVLVPSVIVPPDVGGPGRNTLQVPRVAVRGGEFDGQRLRRHTEVVEIILNSLLRKGRLSQLEDADDFEIVAPGFSATRNPTTSDDITRGATPGISWVNRSAQTVWYCMDATAGAAVWVQVQTV